MTRLLLLAILAGAAIAAAAPPPIAPPLPPRPAELAIDGYYRIAGIEEGKPYKAVCCISKHKEVYAVSVVLPGASAIGVGIRDGNVLVVSAKNDSGTLIVLRYAIEQAGGKPRLVGKWAALGGSGQVQTETLTWLAALEAE